ncbi:MAG TPA: nicotinate-nucleotide adenylyltransferase [Candidatus Acidoferrales bacterium]|nr:nicotinate-nucleotide adenylyltransferase [Candidatus Acidoferrales bacterium]
MKTAAPKKSRASRSIAIFGGTFDPIHSGHLAVANAAARRFHLEAIYFVPSSRPPHKKREELAAFSHRYAMVALAAAEDSKFIPSLAEAPAGLRDPSRDAEIFYSIDTVRRFRREYPRDRIYFIMGADSFLEITIWKSYEALLDSCDFIIASRPGFRIDELRQVLPPKLFSRKPARESSAIALRNSAVHLLTAVSSEISSTEIRRRRKRGASIHGLVPAGVEDYILKQALYR